MKKYITSKLCINCKYNTPNNLFGEHCIFAEQIRCKQYREVKNISKNIEIWYRIGRIDKNKLWQKDNVCIKPTKVRHIKTKNKLKILHTSYTASIYYFYDFARGYQKRGSYIWGDLYRLKDDAIREMIKEYKD